MPRQAVLEQFILWRRTTRRQPEPTFSTATAEAPVQWYSNPAVTAKASVNGYSKYWVSFGLSLPHWAIHWSQSLQFNSAFACVSANSSESTWHMTLHMLSVHLFPSEILWNQMDTAIRESFADMVLERWLTSPCRGETKCIFVWCCCNFSHRVECCYDNDTMLMLHY